MRCPRCGNENSTTNRFCGMCGATLFQASSPETAAPAKPAQVATPSRAPSVPVPPAPPVTHAPTTTSEVSPRSAPSDDGGPVISGPSFLGLNEPAPAKRSRASLSIDPGTSSRSVDYLLEDDEEPKSGGAGKWILIVVALALAVGFGYLHWKDQGFAWLNASKKPAATLPSDSDDTAAAPLPTNNPAPNPGAAVSPATTGKGSQQSPQQSSNSPVPASASTTTSTTPSGAPTSAPATAASNAPTTSAATTPTATDVTNTNPASNSAPPGTASSGTSSSTTATKTTAAKDSGDSASDSSTDADNANPTPAAASKPTPTIKPAPRPVDTVAEAQRYLYGKGAQQNCDRGLRLLKPAADQSNTKAMVEMGALYSAGLCTPRDLPTAYRWFALALRKDPDNESVQADLQKLWGEMTQPERQLAIRLSQ